MDSSQKEDEVSSEGKKCCSVCRTTKTPLWRSGPSGPKSLCNACGIRHRKKQPNSLEPGPDPKNEKVEKKMKKKKGKGGNEPGVGLKRLKSKRRQWGEVERAALLLMALSCGAIFA